MSVISWHRCTLGLPSCNSGQTKVSVKGHRATLTCIVSAPASARCVMRRTAKLPWKTGSRALQGIEAMAHSERGSSETPRKIHLPLLVSVAPPWFLIILSEALHHISRFLPADPATITATISILLSIDLPKASQHVAANTLLQGLQPLLLCSNLRLLSIYCNVQLETAAQMASSCPLLLATKPRALHSRLKLYAKILATEPSSGDMIALMQHLPCMLLICPKTMALRCANLVSSLRISSNSALEILRVEPRLLLLAVSVIRDKVKLLSKELGGGGTAAAVLKAAPRILLLKGSVLQKRVAILKEAFQGRLGSSITARPQVLCIQGSQLRDRLSVMRSMAGAKGMRVLGPSHMRLLQLPASNMKKNFNALEEVFGSAAGELVVQEPLLLVFERSRLKALLDTFVIQLAVPWTRLLAIVRQNPRMLLYLPSRARQLLEVFAERTRMSYSDANHLAESIPGLLWPRKEQYMLPDEIVRVVLEKKGRLARAAATHPLWQRQLRRCKASVLAAMLLADPEDYLRLEYVVTRQLQPLVRLDRALLMRTLDFARRFPDYPLWWEQKQSLGLRAPSISFKAAFSMMFLTLSSSGPCCSGGSARLLLPNGSRGGLEQCSEPYVKVEGDLTWGETEEEERDI